MSLKTSDIRKVDYFMASKSLWRQKKDFLKMLRFASGQKKKEIKTAKKFFSSVHNS